MRCTFAAGMLCAVRLYAGLGDDPSAGNLPNRAEGSPEGELVGGVPRQAKAQRGVGEGNLLVHLGDLQYCQSIATHRRRCEMPGTPSGVAIDINYSPRWKVPTWFAPTNRKDSTPAALPSRRARERRSATRPSLPRRGGRERQRLGRLEAAADAPSYGEFVAEAAIGLRRTRWVFCAREKAGLGVGGPWGGSGRFVQKSSCLAPVETRLIDRASPPSLVSRRSQKQTRASNKPGLARPAVRAHARDARDARDPTAGRPSI